MRLFGALLWSLFLLLALSLEGREAGRTLAEERGLCRLLGHIRDSLAAAPTPLSRVYATFEDEALARAGFLAVLREKGLAAALDEGCLRLSEDALRPVKEYAAALGTRPYTEERAEAERMLETARAALAETEAAYPRKRRLSGTLFFTGGMLVLLLLL